MGKPFVETQQLASRYPAGSRNFKVSTISREDLMALTPEAAQVSGIPYVMDGLQSQLLSLPPRG